MDEATKERLLDQMGAWRHEDEPLVEAIGDTIAAFDGLVFAGHEVRPEGASCCRSRPSSERPLRG